MNRSILCINIMSLSSLGPIDSSPIVDKPDPPKGSHCIPLHHLCANLRRRIVLSDYTYRSTTNMHDRMHIFIVGSVWLGFNPQGSLLRNLEILHIQHTNPFRISWENVMVSSEINISPVLTIRSVVIGLHLSWWSIPVCSQAPILFYIRHSSQRQIFNSLYIFYIKNYHHQGNTR